MFGLVTRGMGRAEFMIGFDNGSYFLQNLNTSFFIHDNIKVEAGYQRIVLHHHQANVVQWRSGRQRERCEEFDQLESKANR